MPMTGNMEQEQSTLDSAEQSSHTDQTADSSGAEVSSTTTDSDFVSQTGQDVIHHESVQSTAMDSTLDLAEGFKDNIASVNESFSKLSSTNVGLGFQDAFAAFASASYREAGDDSPEDVCSEIAPQATAANTCNFSTVDSCVSSAIDSGHVTTTAESFVTSAAETEVSDSTGNERHHPQIMSYTETDHQSTLGVDPCQVEEHTAQTSSQMDTSTTNESVYFIQTTDASGQVVTSIIDPSDIPSYADSVVYKQCMRADGEIETTIVYSAGMTATQEQSQEPAATASEEVSDSQHQIIYAHDINGHLTPIDSSQSFNDIAPPGKQFVYMQDSTGRIIRTVMDADQTMVPGQQVYYTQSDDGRIITSVMDPAIGGESDEPMQGQQSQDSADQAHLQQFGDAGVVTQQQQLQEMNLNGVTSNFNIDNNMSGLSMLAELSHFTAGQAFTAPGLPSEHRAASSTDSSSADQDEFRPIAGVTRPTVSDEGLESVRTDIADLKVDQTGPAGRCGQGTSPLEGNGTGQEETLITRIMLEMEETQASLNVSRDNLFVQWQNLDAMCWMDVVLVMLVNSPSLRPLVNLDPSHELSSTLLITLLKANRQAQVLLQNILKKSNGSEISNLQMGAGNIASMQDPKTSKLVCKENMDEIGKAINILYAMREKIWQALQPRLRCERGKHNSPVLVLPLIIREKPAIKQMFTMSYRYVFKCKQCEYSQDDSQTKILPSIPAVPDDFNMQAPCFVRNCFECSAPDQRMFIKFEVLHDFVQMHFVKGLPHNRFDEFSFDLNGDHYEVTAVVHYKNNPDHFIALVRNAPGSQWMECDDLKSVITSYTDVPPNIPPSQVHMVMWERRLTSCHTLVMRDTEDTKLLASLVLTVQQPNAQQSAADQAARTSGLPSNPASTTSALTTSSSQANLQSAATALTQRPRVRGKGRGTFNSHQAPLTTSSPVIRRVSPAITQLPSPANSVSNISPQVIRLPLSALTSSGLNLQGGASAGTRYVLVGNNSQTGTNLTRAQPVSKVVVVRSQGGAANISAAQLLQLLQCTGAISQSGARITTTVTSSGANSSGSTEPSTTSYIIQQDGTIVATPTNSEVGLRQSSSSTPLTESINERLASVTTVSSETKPIKSTINSTQTISTLPYMAPASSRGHTPASDALMHSSEQALSTTPVEQSTASSDDAETPTEQTGFARQTVSLMHNQQPTRYIQVPNPAGGGMLLCQLGVKDGKTVLVPVDKNSQVQASGASILKLSATPSSSPKITIRVPTTSPQVTSQVQQQMLQGHGSTTSGSHFITLPGAAGGKKIQLITVPHGSSTSLPASKTIIVGGQQTTSSIVSPGQTGMDNQVLTQPGNIVIRELKHTDTDTVTTSSLPADGHGIDTSSGRVVSTQTVSVLKHVPARHMTSGLGMSLLTSPTKLQKSPENFRYILPGSNTTHILHTGPSGGMTGQVGRTFTALSSSGTIIGGQLTPSPTAASVETSPMNQEQADSDDNDQGIPLLTSRQQLSRELETTEYIPLGRGRGKTRGQRVGRVRGGRTPRGRGRSQLWTSEADLIAPISASTHKISTLADLRQIGAHVIDTGSETVDGVPVVSIPDFTTDRTGQREILSAAQSIISENADQGTPHSSDAASQLISGELENSGLSEAALTSPRVITQPIPSYRHNHGFDILTQGILGATTIRSPSLRQARSLLTGATTTIPATSSLVSSLAESASSAASIVQKVIGQTESSSLVSGMPTVQVLEQDEIESSFVSDVPTVQVLEQDEIESSLASGMPTVQVLEQDEIESSFVPEICTVQQDMRQIEIDTLIQAAQAAAKPPTAGVRTPFSDICTEYAEQSSIDLAVNNLIKPSHVNSSLDNSEIVGMSDSKVTQEELDDVESFDESQVSTAERYQMPVELFQPDEGSPQKRADDIHGKLTVDLPSRLVSDTETSTTRNDSAKSVQKKRRRVTGRRTVRKFEKGSVEDDPHKSKELILEYGRDQPILVDESRPENSATEGETSMKVDPNTFDDQLMADAHKDGRTEPPSNIEYASTSRSLDVSNVLAATDEAETNLLHATDKTEQTMEATETNLLRAMEEIEMSLLQVRDETQITLPVRKVGRPRKRTRGRYNKQDSGRKTNAALTAEFSGISNPHLSAVSIVTPDSSPEGITAHPVNSIEATHLQHSPDSSPVKYSKQNSANVSFGSELLFQKSDDEKEIRPADEESSKDILQDKHEMAAFVPKQMHDIDTGSKKNTYTPAIVRDRKGKVDWGTDIWPHPKSCFSYKVLTGRARKSPHYRHPSLLPASESYTWVSTTKPSGKVSQSHQSLAALVVTRHPRPRQKPISDPASEPTVIPLVMEDNCDPSCTGGSVVTSIDGVEIFTGVIVRHRRERTNWNTSLDEDDEVLEYETEEELKTVQKEFCKQLMTVLYIHAGDFSAVLHDHLDDCLEEDEKINVSKEKIDVQISHTETKDQIFGEEIVDKISCEEIAENISHDEIADKISHDEIAEKISHDEIAENISHDEIADKISHDEIAEKISGEEIDDKVSGEEMTCKISCEEVAENTCVSQEGVIKLERCGTVDFEKQTEPLTAVIGPDIFVDNLASSSKGRKKKRRPSASPIQATKKTRISQDGQSDSSSMSPAHFTSFSAVDTANSSLAAVPSRLNGIDTISSPGYSSQTSDSDTGHCQQKGKPVVTTQLPFHSPSRRSSRTPVPSKKFLDSWEEYPVRGLALMDRRTLSLSSDEEISSLGSGEKRRKKQKTKQTFVPS